jgi:DNA-binding transcriptional regulator GbsR (MarR family)
MEYKDARDKFIKSWGELATNWGVNKTMGLIHGLLLISEKPLCIEDIMVELEISKSNSNANMKTLHDWGLIYKTAETGDRKDYYIAEKQTWKIFLKIIEHRKKKELDPLKDLLIEMKTVNPICCESKELCTMIHELAYFTKKVDGVLDTIVKAESSFLLQSFVKMVR